MAEALWFALAAAVVSYVATHVAISALPRLGMVSTPDPNHANPVPVGGGIALWVSTGTGLLVMAMMGHPVASMGKIFMGASVLFVAGVWDDVWLLAPRTKLLIQVSVASLMIIAGVTFPLGPGLEWVSVPLTLLWFVGLCNAFNLVDNMDGMLPGIAAVAAIFVGLFAFATGRPETGFLSWIVAGACLGFLRFNLPPAKIFLGDSGSMFLGFLLAGLAIGDSWRGMTQVGLTVLAPTLLLAVPIFNTTFVTITRKLSGIPLSLGKADHINYRLLAHGLSRGRALGAVYVLSIVAGAFGLLVVTVTPLAYAAGAILFVILLMYLGVFLYEGRVQQFYGDFEVEKMRPGWEESPWYRWVIRVMAVSGDVLLVFASLYAAFYLRFDGSIPRDQLQNLAQILPYLILFRVGLGLVMGIYETRWRLGLAPDAMRLVWSVVLGTLLFTALVLLLRLPSFPRTVIVIEGVISLVFFGVTRLGVRGLGEVAARERVSRSGRRTIIAGSSDGFLTVYRAIRDRNDGEYNVIGFADDDPLAHRSLVAGVRVLGSISKLPALARLAGAEHIIFIFPAGSEHQVEGHLKAVLATGLTAEVARLEVESAEDWLRGRTKVSVS